ncbi:phosphate import ATP-binding protein pstB [Striga asiatica]|uniref:Phosphate import ATP-binding protein pstB n=1 Tax=Striga asiatica TaxID=4170 RepID=A0A5A7PMQ6_STRAF|nr:phosphate import ATP-binding protein pstB [Striga asiatica]
MAPKATCWKVLREARIDPPIQTLYFLSGGATTFIFILLGARAVISLLIRSAIPGNMKLPFRPATAGTGPPGSGTSLPLRLELLVKVECHVGELLLHISDYFTLSGGSEHVASLGQDLHEEVSEVTTGEIQT